MTPRRFAEWVSSLVLVGQEAYLPSEADELGLLHQPPLRRCRRCGAHYIKGLYSEHADTTHTDPACRREREKKRRLYAQRRAA